MMTIRNLLAGLALALASVTCLATDINKASQAELESIKGIRPSMSAASSRSARRSVPVLGRCDLERVKGHQAGLRHPLLQRRADGQRERLALPAAPATTPVAAAGPDDGVSRW